LDDCPIAQGQIISVQHERIMNGKIV
jgi:hypothetical protein